MLKVIAWKTIAGILTAIAIAYLLACFYLWRFQTRLIFLPQQALPITPDQLNLPHQDVWIPVDHGGQIHGWWLPSVVTTDKTLLYLHGNGSNIAGNLGLAYRFQRLGLNVLLIDYRGYGRSSGPFPNEQRVYEDATAAWRYLTQTRQISPEHIVLYGHSIGGAIALELAQRHPEAAGLIMEGAFTSMRAMANYLGYTRLFPGWLVHQRFDNRQKIRTLQMPVFLIHGSADRTVPAFMSEQLHAVAPEPKRLWQVPNANHADLADVAGDTYEQQIQAWLRQLASPSHP